MLHIPFSLCWRKEKHTLSSPISVCERGERKWEAFWQHTQSPINHVSWVCREAFLHWRCGQRRNVRIFRLIPCFARKSGSLVSILPSSFFALLFFSLLFVPVRTLMGDLPFAALMLKWGATWWPKNENFVLFVAWLMDNGFDVVILCWSSWNFDEIFSAVLIISMHDSEYVLYWIWMTHTFE